MAGAVRTAAPFLDLYWGDRFAFRDRLRSLVKIIWYDDLGMSLYAKRRFIWPSANDGVVPLTALLLTCLLDGIDRRNPAVQPLLGEGRVELYCLHHEAEGDSFCLVAAAKSPFPDDVEALNALLTTALERAGDAEAPAVSALARKIAIEA